VSNVPGRWLARFLVLFYHHHHEWPRQTRLPLSTVATGGSPSLHTYRYMYSSPFEWR